MEHLIHKVKITNEAEFDVECMNAPSNFDKDKIKKELEFFIKHQHQLHNKHYFRLNDYLGDVPIIYFIKRSHKFRKMQIWKVVGICESQYWDEELEDYGIIRGWYETKLNPAKDDKDWVEELREKELLEERERKLEEEQQKWYERKFGY